MNRKHILEVSQKSEAQKGHLFLPACVHNNSEKLAFNRKTMFKDKGSKIITHRY